MCFGFGFGFALCFGVVDVVVVVVAAAPPTVKLPFIVGCASQMYLYVPATSVTVKV